MIKETITYTDYNGIERTEDFYFNLNKAEVTKMEMGISGGMSAMINQIVATKDTPSLIKIFEDLIQMSYGVKTLDGKGFHKRKEDLEAFISTEAYSELFMKLATDADAAARFVNGVLPSDPNKQVTKPQLV